MYSLRRWWSLYGSSLLLAVTALGSAWVLRQTQGSLLLEVYYQVSRPFQVQQTQMQALEQASRIEDQERLIELENQNAQLKRLLGQSQPGVGERIFSPIVGRSADQWWQQVLLGRGSNHGIQAGAIATAPGGLVGRVTQVTPNTSRVLLITDATSSVGVMISRSRAQAYARGQGTDHMVVRFFDKDPDVRPGDVVTTSAMSTLFPAGIPVGVVETVSLKTSPTPEALVRLNAPISRLEWVQVMPFTPPAVPPSPNLPPSSNPSRP
ncbi:MAG: rod shape-determining protein MreC [Prochlorothrix sp.]|nr:rod shape-determining protein MreC [Prochlorothrix sp.]